MHAYSLVTPSHRPLQQGWYLRTLPEEIEPHFLEVEAAPVDFGTRHWLRVVVRKFDLLEQAFAERPAGSIFLLSDVDIRFYKPIMRDLQRRMDGLDVLFQNNRPQDPHPCRYLCTGFAVIRSGDRAARFFEVARRVLETADDPLVGDQVACIRAIERDPEAIRFGLLPEEYWVPPRGDRRWLPGDPLAPPPNIRLHHANYTVGVARKLAQLEMVERAMGAHHAPVAQRA
ncbi:MAG: putative nucleotide-diphospho-sugar transferase [Pseudomonadota bacterium]